MMMMMLRVFSYSTCLSWF